MISLVIAGKSLGLAAINCLAKFMILASLLGAQSRVPVILGEKICDRERMVGRSAEGCSVSKTKWQNGFGSSRVLRRAFWAASFITSAGAMIK